MTGEEEFIDTLIKKTGQNNSRIGDDCAIVDTFSPPLLMTVDSMNKDIHYDSGFSPTQIGKKLAGVNLSDVAAMGGTPKWALSSINSSKPQKDVEEIMDGLLNQLDKEGVALVGGDLSRTSNDCESLGLTVIGQTHSEGILKRDQAEVGDNIAITGTLGGVSAILSQDPGERSQEEQSLLSCPSYQLETAQTLVTSGIKCGIDISDGLLKDLKRICSQSGVGATLDYHKIPIHSKAKQYTDDPTTALKWALTGGEEFQLLVTCPPDTYVDDLTIIGSITEHPGIEWDPALPDEVDLARSGYDHLSEA